MQKKSNQTTNVGPSSKKSESDTSNTQDGTPFWKKKPETQSLVTARLVPTHQGLDYKEEREKECCNII